MLLYIPALLACLNGQCELLSAERSVDSEQACRQVVIQELVPRINPNLPKELEVMGLCVPYKVEKV